MPFDRKFMSPNTFSCMHRGPNCVACRTPVQFFGGFGGAHRKSPTGGSAKGIPLNARTPLVWVAEPSRVPLAVLTRSAPNNEAMDMVRIRVLPIRVRAIYSDSPGGDADYNNGREGVADQRNRPREQAANWRGAGNCVSPAASSAASSSGTWAGCGTGFRKGVRRSPSPTSDTPSELRFPLPHVLSID